MEIESLRVLMYIAIALNLSACILNMIAWGRNLRAEKMYVETEVVFRETIKEYINDKENKNDERNNEHPSSIDGIENT